MTAVPTYPNKKNRISDCHLFSPFQCGLAARNWRFCLISSVGAKDYGFVPSDAHAGSRRKRLFAAYIRSACPGRQAQRKMGARCALIFDLELLTGFEPAPAKNSPPDCFLNASRFVRFAPGKTKYGLRSPVFIADWLKTQLRTKSNRRVAYCVLSNMRAREFTET